MRLAVFASGGGSNFQSIIDAAESGSLPAEIVLCVSNNSDAGALRRAREHEIATLVIDPNHFDHVGEYEERLLDSLSRYHIDFIALAGYMRLIPASVVSRYRNRILNIHPALLPAFGGPGMYGRRVHQAVIQSGVKESGATVHLVDEEYDSGPVILQEAVPVLEDDSPESLAARILEVEHRIYPKALALFATDQITIDGRDIVIHDN